VEKWLSSYFRKLPQKSTFILIGSKPLLTMILAHMSG